MKTKSLLSIMIIAVMIITAFGAVYAAEKDNPAYEHALALKDAGILYGMPDGTFGLDLPFLRSEAIAILLRALNLEDEAKTIAYEPIFEDVPESHWAAKLINYAYNQGITKGTSDTGFSPEREVTAQEFCTLMLRYKLNERLITPDTVFGYIVTQTPLDVNFIEKVFAKDVFTRDDMVEIIYGLCLQDGVPGGDDVTDEEIAKGQIITPDAVAFAEVGDILLIEVEVNASTGYHWIPDVADGSVVDIIDCLDNSEKKDDGADAGLIVGAPSTMTYVLKAVAKGVAIINMAHIAPGDQEENNEMYGYTVVVTEPGKPLPELDTEAKNVITVGDLAMIKLDSNATTGFTWVAEDNEFIALVADEYIAPETATGVVGAPGVQVLIFKAVKAGEAELTLNYARTFEKDAEPAETITINVEIK